jgi:Lamin Tail Domain
MFSRAQILSLIIVTGLTLVHAYVCNAQFTDNFSDGDFNANPAWSGTDSKFSAATGVLKLAAPAVSETAYLSTPSESINNASWEFLVTIANGTSASNYTDVYLVSSAEVLTGTLNGYFVRIGNTSDEVSLYVQTGTTKTEIIDGLDARVNGAAATIKIKVTRDSNGLWQLSTDATSSGYVVEGSITHATHSSSAYAGVVCVYTATRSLDYSFDDFIVTGDPFVDPSQPADYKDVIITEIFADPSPVIGLPEAEFIEIHNRSEKIINLSDWKFTDGSSTATLSGFLQPGEYKIITATASASLFTTFGAVLGVANFPTLNNASDNLELKRSDDRLIDKVSYSDAWYRDEDKKQGGFTLELIDPANPCGEGDNWMAAETSAGGTPGTQNSVFENKPDLTGPKLISAIPISATALLVKFNEKLYATLPTANSFAFEPAITVSNLIFTDPSLTTLSIAFSQDLQSGTLYSVAVQNIYDCNGNEIQPNFSVAEFALPEAAAEKDILINEILFNPRPTGTDFVEVYNNSNKYINLKNWSIANYADEAIVNARPITTEDVLIRPHSYFVFTEDKNVLKGEYVQAHEESMITVADLPSFNDDEGTVVLVDPNNTIIDFFSYTDDYHAVFLKDDEGVSLERISFSALTNDAANWQSASSTVGYATPGYVNSNARGETLADNVKVDPEIFEPVVGQPAFTQIHYNFSAVGYVANIRILDYQGREIKQLVNNATLATSGFFRWDGDMNDGTKARTGYYIVWVEVFNATGKVDSFRKKVVVASRFK